MKSILKKASAVMLSIFMLTQTMVLSASSEDGKLTFSDSWLNFEPWTGSGTTSVSIGDDYLTKDRGIVSYDEFEELRYNSDDKALDYTVAESNGNTVITLAEDYLKTLDDGTYNLEAVFSKAIIPLKLYIVTQKVELKDEYNFDAWNGSGSAQVKLPSTDSIKFETALFKSLKYNGNEVADSNYSVSQFANILYITLKEEYVKTLAGGVHNFEADFLNVSVMLKLTIATQEQPSTSVSPVKIVEKVKPSVAKVKKVSAKNTSKKKQLKVTWKKVSGANGYKVKVSLSKKFKSAKKFNTIKKTINKNKTSATLKVKKSNKKYYVKVCAYKTYKDSNGKTVKAWGKWSSVKTVKAK